MTVDGKHGRFEINRNAQLQEIPSMFVVGAREVASRQMVLRSRVHGDDGPVEVDAFVSRIPSEISDGHPMQGGSSVK